MKQRMGDKNRRMVEEKTGKPVRSMWHRGGRNPRYWEVFFGTPDDEEGEVGYWYPEYVEKVGGKKIHHQERLVMSDIPWKARRTL